jgi:hypothetical protein
MNDLEGASDTATPGKFYPVVQSEMATFFSVFPDGIVWVNDREDGADVALLSQVDPALIDVDAIAQRFNDNARAAASLCGAGRGGRPREGRDGHRRIR